MILDEIVVEERRAENVIAFGQVNAHLAVGERIEVDQLGGLGLDVQSVEQLAVHLEGHFDRLGVGAALAGETEADGVFAVEIDAMRWLRRC